MKSEGLIKVNASKASDEKRILGLIPARGGSKRLPRKNVKLLKGKPLIEWSIKQAKRSHLISRVVVSTDDEEIASIAKKCGAEVPFLRPEHLARDDSSSIDVILHCLDFFSNHGETFDVVLLIEPTSPLRKKQDLDNGLTLLLDNFDRADSVISVGEIHLEHPKWVKRIDEGYVKPFYGDSDRQEQQFLNEKAYFPYGVLYASKVTTLRKYQTFYQPRTLPYFIDRWQCYEIDDIYDFICIEGILNMMATEVEG